MSRSIIILSFLFPFLGNAQFNLEIVAIDLENYSEISDVYFTLGDVPSMTYYGDARFSNVDVALLGDTLFAKHTGYKFEALPLTANNYKVVGNKLEIKVYGRPWIQKQLNVNVPIAKSKKVKNDTVNIQRSWGGPNAIISFEPTNQKSKNNRTKTGPFKRAYDDLENGDFILRSDSDVSRVPFKKQDWYQVACLRNTEEIQANERELHLLEIYFLSLENAELEKQNLEQEHQVELNNLQLEIDELEQEARRLKGLPVSHDISPPEPVEEAEVEWVYDFVNEEAVPPGGFQQFKFGIYTEIAALSTQFSGNITIEISVEKNGRVRSNILHSGKDKLEIAKQIQEYCNNTRWEPARRSGRSVKYQVILSLNIGTSK